MHRHWTPTDPLVFCHGLFGFNKVGPEAVPLLQISYWRGVKEALEAAGVEVLITQVPASASVEERARILCEVITEKMPGREVNLIGHSMVSLSKLVLLLPLTEHLGRIGRALSHLTAQTDHLQSPVDNDNRFTSQRLCLCVSGLHVFVVYV